MDIQIAIKSLLFRMHSGSGACGLILEAGLVGVLKRLIYM
jgi:hypothetical protein